MKKDNNKNLLVKERQKAVKEIFLRLETLDIGNEIRLALETSGFSKQDLADIIGCDRSNITDICKRKNHMNLVQLVLISVVLEQNFLDKVFDLLEPEQESILSERYTIDISPSLVRIINQTEQSSVKTFRLQNE